MRCQAQRQADSLDSRRKACYSFIHCEMQVLVTYGTRVLTLPSPPDPYGAKYKGIWICLLILARALGGTYVNFGVFELYGDPTLRVSLLCW